MSTGVDNPLTAVYTSSNAESASKAGHNSTRRMSVSTTASKITGTVNWSHKEPNFYAKFVTGFPKMAFGLTLSGHVMLMMTNFILLAVGYDILPVEFIRFPLHLRDDVIAQRDVAWQLRNVDDPDHVTRITVNTVGPTWIRGYAIDHMLLYYTRSGGKGHENVFDRDVLLQMKDLEDSLYNLTSYQSSYCQLDDSSTCIRPKSILRYFDGTYSHLGSVFYDPDFANISQVLYEASRNPSTAADFLYFAGKGYRVTESEAWSNVTRSSVPIGWPLDLNGSSTEKQNKKLIDEFLQEEVKPVIKTTMKQLNYGLELCYYSYMTFSYDAPRQAFLDMLLAFGSLIFIFGFIWFQTKSLWVTGFAVLSIITSFWITNLVYRIVFDYQYFGYLHIIAIFVILGIGADDLFVFFDAWVASGQVGPLSLAHRLSDCYRRAAASMFFTSFTTAAAFAVGIVSPLLPLASFGAFTTVLVIVNYVSVIIFFPCVLVTHHLYWESAACCCCCCCCCSSRCDCARSCQDSDGMSDTSEIIVDVNDASVITYSNATFVASETIVADDAIDDGYCSCQQTDANRVTVEVHHREESPSLMMPSAKGDDIRISNVGDCKSDIESSRQNNGYVLNVNDTSQRSDVENEARPRVAVGSRLSNRSRSRRRSLPGVDDDIKKPSVIVIFFRDYYFAFITNKVVRWILIVAFLSVVAFLTYWATKLEPDPEQVKVYRKEANYGKAMTLESSAFVPSGDAFVKIMLVWGMKPRDFSDCHKSDYLCTGSQVWDDVVDMNNPLAQVALQDFCYKLKHGLSTEKINELMIRNHSLDGTLEIDCFMDNMQSYLKLSERLLPNISLSYPLTQKNMEPFMDSFPRVYEPWRLASTFYRYFEIGLSWWMSASYTMRATEDYLTYNDLVGENLDGNNTQSVKYQVENFNRTFSYYGTKLRYFAIRVNLSLSTQELNYKKGFPVMDSWESFINEELATMPIQLQGGYQTTVNVWHWLKVQKTLTMNAITGIVIGICIALPILIVATMNVIGGTFATLIIAFVTICVLGILPLAGWKLDVTVSLTLAILVGLSVDYVVHLAEAYHHSPYTDRQSRTRHMLQALGPSVLSGAATTIGASFFMLFAKIQFLLQFASCLMATIGFSLFFSLALFTTVMAMVGPEGDTGSIVEFFRWLKRLLLGDRRKGEVYCPTCKGTGFVGDKCIAAADLNGSFYAEQENSMLKHADLQWTERPPADSSIAARIDRDPTAVDDGRGRSNTSPEEQQHRTDCSGCELYATEAPEESDVAEDRRGSHREVSIDIEKF